MVRRSRLRLAAHLAFSIGFVAICLMGLGVFGENTFLNKPDQSGRILVWLAVFFFAANGVSISRKILRGGETLRFDESGIHFSSNATIPWEQVRSAKKWTQTIPSGSIFPVRMRWLVFDVEPSFEADLPVLKIWGRDLNYGLSGGSHAITASGTDRSIEAILVGFNRFAPERLRVSLD